MAISINKVMLVGRVGHDPEAKGRDGSFVKFSVATSESWKDKSSGERRERTQWHNVVVFNEQAAKFCERYVKKGDLVSVEGQLETREYEGKYYTEVIVRPFSGSVQAISKDRAGGSSGDAGGASADSGSGERTYSSGRPGTNRGGTPDMSGLDDDIPF